MAVGDLDGGGDLATAPIDTLTVVVVIRHPSTILLTTDDGMDAKTRRLGGWPRTLKNEVLATAGISAHSITSVTVLKPLSSPSDGLSAAMMGSLRKPPYERAPSSNLFGLSQNGPDN